MPFIRLGTIPVLTLLALAGACASHGAPGPEPVSANAAATRQSEVITQAELDEAASEGNALDVIRRLRPYYLRARGATSFALPSGNVTLSIDGGPLLPIDNLARLRPRELAEIRYLSPADATQRFGTAAGTGPVILVKSR
jgi:hypothetical protein